MKLPACIAVLIMLASPVQAIDEKGRTFVWGPKTCGEWLEATKANGYERTIYNWWLSGYLSAVNIYVPGKQNWLEGSDIPSAMHWIDNYCSKNPLKPAVSAAGMLVKELRSR